MADDTLRLGIEADASGVDKGVRDAEKSLDRLGDSVDREAKNLNRYGEKLGRAFGPGEGLHGRLTELETPLRDSEGAFARAQMAVIEFGNDGATAADKIGAGFLLAGDSIAAFSSGGVVGIAIAAGVAGISLLTQMMDEEAAAAQEAEEAQKKHADELKNLAKSAAAANATIALLNAKQRKDEAIERARALEQEIADVKEQGARMIDQRNTLLDRLQKTTDAKALLRGKAAAKAQLREIEKLEEHGADLIAEFNKIQNGILEAQKDVVRETEKNQESIITGLIDFLNTADKTTTTAVEKETEKRVQAVRNFRDVMAEYAKDEKERTMAQQALRKEDEAFDKRREERAQKRQADAQKRFHERRAQERKEILAILDEKKELEQADKKTAEEAEKAAEKRLSAFMKTYESEIRIGQQVVNALYEQAKAGEISAQALLATVIDATGKELVTKGTGYVLTGLAQLASTAGVQGGPTVAAGSAMIAAGVGMGAASGAITRSAQPATSASSTPTDTRQSRAASTAGGSEGGTTVINFNGPAYDRRGVANVLNAGQKMARHRRVMGA
jgi:hypothetical protein